ncbi:MAG: PAS domain S-box protein, partial [Actinobacteria bacterium]|nr:PAS domain S-box protein [Actinomycetota bacterium]
CAPRSPRSTARQSRCGVALIDTDGTILLWNRAAETITGLPHENVVGRSAEEALAVHVEASSANVPLDGSRAETLPVDIGGRELWLSVSRVQFDEGTVYAFRDVTQERALDQMRSEMVATGSHELRTPLAAIYGAAITLRRRSDGLDPPTRENLLRVVEEEAERLAGIVGEVLLANQLDAGEVQLTIGTVDARALTESVAEAARVHLPADVTVTVEGPDDLPPVAADEPHLRQVLVNLVENAVKYSPDGGLVTVSLAEHGRHVQWAVRDEGLGIPEGERDRVFEKFYRLDPNMTRGVGGTGLGLYISRELVRRLGGRIWVEPNGEKGSAFLVRIPVAAEADVPRRAREKQAV